MKILDEVLHLTCGGISMIRATPNAIKVLYSIDGDESEAARNEIAAAEHRAALAQREVDSGFNIVHSQAVVSLWGALEDAVRTFVARWLMNLPEWRTQGPWAELKVKLGEYERLDGEEKAYFLVGLIEQNTGAPMKRGVNRFESLLEGLGLTGGAGDETRDAIFEMQQVRNVIAHRRGIADHRFCRMCPSFGAKPNQRLQISHEQWQRYSAAAGSYIHELICRVGEHFGDLTIRERSSKAGSRAGSASQDTPRQTDSTQTESL
jgi:hypothetical protein